MKYGDPKEFLKNFEQFKRFDIVEDFCHHYAKTSYSTSSRQRIGQRKFRMYS
ncbi:hypothetical protein OROHE_019517 [Orobanche hederae]